MRGEFPAMRFSPALPLLSSARYWAKVADSFPSTTDPGVAGSNPFCSTIQSFSSRTNRPKSARVRAIFRLRTDPENASHGAIRRNHAKVIRA
jgi:hypothetical protein